MCSRMAYDRIPLAGCVACGNEHLISKKAGNFFGQLIQFFKKIFGFFSSDLCTFSV